MATRPFAKGKGFWKFNNSLLFDKDYILKVKNVIKESKMEYAVPIYNRDNIEDIDEMQLQFTINDQTFLDTLLMKIRSITIPYASHKKKSKNEKRENIEKELIALQLLHQNDTGDITLENKIQELNIELENIRKEELKGLIIRARTRWIEYDVGTERTCVRMLR